MVGNHANPVVAEVLTWTRKAEPCGTLLILDYHQLSTPNPVVPSSSSIIINYQHLTLWYPAHPHSSTPVFVEPWSPDLIVFLYFFVPAGSLEGSGDKGTFMLASL